MNKDFEIAKVFATLAGFFVVGSSIYFSWFLNSSEQHFDYIESQISNPNWSNPKLVASLRSFDVSLYKTWTVIFGISIILVFLSVYFAIKGYRREK